MVLQERRAEDYGDDPVQVKKDYGLDSNLLESQY
jgi:hypothetical protein